MLWSHAKVTANDIYLRYTPSLLPRIFRRLAVTSFLHKPDTDIQQPPDFCKRLQRTCAPKPRIHTHSLWSALPDASAGQLQALPMLLISTFPRFFKENLVSIGDFVPFFRLFTGEHELLAVDDWPLQ